MTEHVTILNPAELMFCHECGKGNFAASGRFHEKGFGEEYDCTWADCDNGLTIPDVQLEWDEELCVIQTEAGMCLGWRKKLHALYTQHMGPRPSMHIIESSTDPEYLEERRQEEKLKPGADGMIFWVDRA